MRRLAVFVLALVAGVTFAAPIAQACDDGGGYWNCTEYEGGVYCLWYGG